MGVEDPHKISALFNFPKAVYYNVRFNTHPYHFPLPSF